LGYAGSGFSRRVQKVKFVRLLALAAIALRGLPLAVTQTSAPPSAPALQSAAQPVTAAATAGLPIDTLPRKYVDLWNTGDFDQFKPYFSPFFMTSHGPRVLVNEAMLRRVVAAWRKSMPDLTFKIEDTVIQGDTVAMRLTMKGTYKNIVFPFTVQPGPDDAPRTIRAAEMLFFRMKDGKIAEIWEQYDELVMRQQMGGSWSAPAKPSPSSTASPQPTPPVAKP
jgi:steroid delta-isomerase-like uncharacterized protein